mmetsp:Transcript_102662/g.162246  ORF Transcript_102662/g.162246 Transcript_102662/m.162246 type:complete len:125 (+) Transcript_102662:2941-3315(+)
MGVVARVPTAVDAAERLALLVSLQHSGCDESKKREAWESGTVATTEGIDCVLPASDRGRSGRLHCRIRDPTLEVLNTEYFWFASLVGLCSGLPPNVFLRFASLFGLRSGFPPVECRRLHSTLLL